MHDQHRTITPSNRPTRRAQAVARPASRVAVIPNGINQAHFAAAPGVAAVHFTRATPLRLSTDAPPVALVAQPVTRDNVLKMVPGTKSRSAR